MYDLIQFQEDKKIKQLLHFPSKKSDMSWHIGAGHQSRDISILKTAVKLHLQESHIKKLILKQQLFNDALPGFEIYYERIGGFICAVIRHLESQQIIQLRIQSFALERDYVDEIISGLKYECALLFYILMYLLSDLEFTEEQAIEMEQFIRDSFDK